MKRSSLCLFVALAAVALAADPSADEAANRKLIAHWQTDLERMQRLEANLLAFRALPTAAQEKMRQFDRSLHELDAPTQARLKAVMERYAGWLSRLSPEDRARVQAAPPGLERLKVVDALLDRQWQESLPQPDRDRLAKATGEERGELLKNLRKEEDERRELRRSARRAADEAMATGALPGFVQAEFFQRLRSTIDESLRPLLAPQEEEQLNRNRGALNKYYQLVQDFAQTKLPLPFPGPAPLNRKKAYLHWKELPVEITGKLPKALPPFVTAAEGKWPAFPLAVVTWALERNVVIPTDLLGPTKLDELPPSVQKFVREDLMPKLSDDEKAHLTSAEGKWPDYPKKVRELADQHKLVVPGLALPGEPDVWQRLKNFRPGRGPGGAVPS